MDQDAAAAAATVHVMQTMPARSYVMWEGGVGIFWEFDVLLLYERKLGYVEIFCWT